MWVLLKMPWIPPNSSDKYFFYENNTHWITKHYFKKYRLYICIVKDRNSNRGHSNCIDSYKWICFCSVCLKDMDTFYVWIINVKMLNLFTWHKIVGAVCKSLSKSNSKIFLLNSKPIPPFPDPIAECIARSEYFYM